MTPVNDDEFLAVIARDIPSVVVFTAGWCVPSLLFLKALEAEPVSESMWHYNLDNYQLEAAKQGLVAVPTVIRYFREKEVDRKVGNINMQLFKQWLNEFK